MKKPLLLMIASVMLLSSLIWFFFQTSLVSASTGYVYYLRPGLSKKALINDLAQQKVLTCVFPYLLYLHLHKQDALKTGEYRFPQGATFLNIWYQVTHGTGFVYYSFTIVPGWSFQQMRQALQEAKVRHATTALTAEQIMAGLGKPMISPEGQFFPETYYYTLNVPDWVLFKRALDLMQRKLERAWQARAPDLPYQNSYQALIAASLIEKEAYLATERPMIAGVLVNRLRKGMILQIDSTVIYGLGEHYTGAIHKKDLLEDTAYNTYLHKGLPPTPIAMPSWLAIEAALHPQQHPYYYFVAKGDGGHQFSITLPQHHEAVKQATSGMKHE